MANQSAYKPLQDVSGAHCNQPNKLGGPKTNSIHRHLNYMVELQKCKPNECSKPSLSQPSEVTKKLNFCPSHVVFNNLISLNVNDLSLTSKRNKNSSQKKSIKKDEQSGSNLEEYLEPLDPFVNVVFEPDITINCYENDFDSIRCYYRFIK
uniref:Protein phosphatase 1 regulatory subunit 35 C-terminal domain-containing protein n=1 Tax=Glossina austeni TaxID=7395 RepID=A0A1A9VS63_GLOAU